jgi:hypothetical protein
MKEKYCSTCLFWVQYVDGQGSPIKNWPRPDVNDWCGEWSAKVLNVSKHSNAEQC